MDITSQKKVNGYRTAASMENIKTFVKLILYTKKVDMSNKK